MLNIVGFTWLLQYFPKNRAIKEKRTKKKFKKKSSDGH